MTSYYYVTGTNRGIGRALTERLLQDADARVIGIGRTAGPSYARYQHVDLDLNDLDAVSAFRFGAHEDAGRIVLVNNAGVLAPRFLGREDADSIRRSFSVNTMAPLLLMNAFIDAYAELPVDLVVCNLSSLAASRAIPGAGVYSATKAALEMVSRTLAEEAKFLGRTRLAVLCPEPGSVDTDMQGVLRASDEADFPGAARNRDMKARGSLASPEVIADRLVRVITNPAIAPDVVFSLADLPA